MLFVLFIAWLRPLGGPPTRPRSEWPHNLSEFGDWLFDALPLWAASLVSRVRWLSYCVCVPNSFLFGWDEGKSHFDFQPHVFCFSYRFSAPVLLASVFSSILAAVATSFDSIRHTPIYVYHCIDLNNGTIVEQSNGIPWNFWWWSVVSTKWIFFTFDLKCELVLEALDGTRVAQLRP